MYTTMSIPHRLKGNNYSWNNKLEYSDNTLLEVIRNWYKHNYCVNQMNYIGHKFILSLNSNLISNVESLLAIRYLYKLYIFISHGCLVVFDYTLLILKSLVDSPIIIRLKNPYKPCSK